MAQESALTRRYGFWILLASSVAGMITAVTAAFDEGNGIAYSGGAYVVLVSTALLLLGVLALALYGVLKWLTISLTILIFLDLVGTAVAAYFLETPVLLASMVLGLVGWLIYLLVDPANGNPLPYGVTGRATR
ncbi:hypothetical protein ACWAUC_15105 [Bradyrhizobium guangdongense]